MRKPTWMDLGIAVIGLFLVCGAAQEGAQSRGVYGTVDWNNEDTAQGPTGTAQGTYGTGGSGDVTTDQGMTQGTTGTTGTGQGTTGTEQGTGGAGDATAQGTTGTGQASDVESQQRLEIARLRVEIARLQQELARTRAQLSQRSTGAQGTGGAGIGGSGNEGTGGSGDAGTGGGSTGVGNANAEAPEGATGVGDTSAEGVGGGGRPGASQQPARPDTSNQGYAVAHVIYTGRVRSVSPQQLVLEYEGGGSNTLALARDVRVLRGQQQLSLQSLREGTLVRASADLYTRGNPVTQIEVIPPSRQESKK